MWQLPQNLLGLFIRECYHKTSRYMYRGKHYQYSDNFSGGISLGEYVIIGDEWQATKDHEYGHTVQSLRWGWLYLAIPGLVSIVRAGLNLYKPGCYYKSWPEKQADKYGGVDRKYYNL